MAVKAKAEITLYLSAGVEAVYRYYLLQESTLAAPSKPTAVPPPNPWDDTEPSYVEGSTRSLYAVDLTVLTDGTMIYSEVSKSSSYEAAKVAYNKAVAAGDAAQEAQNAADEKVGALGEEIAGALADTNTALGETQEGQKEFLTVAQFEEHSTSMETFFTEALAAGMAELREDLAAEVNTLNDLIQGPGSEAGAEGVEEMQLGGFKWLARTNGNLGLVWTGGDE